MSASKKEFRRTGRVVLYQLMNGNTDSQRQNVGYQLAIASQSGKIDRFWSYEARELRWAIAGFETLIDAQTRDVLGQRSAWRPYDADSCVTIGPRITRSGLADRLDGRHEASSRIPKGVAA